jgi:tetratricopeptide (TPR) repeat protein
MTILNIPDELTCEIRQDKVRFSINGISTNWMDRNDSFTERIDIDNLNPNRLADHLVKEIKIKNTLDEARDYLNKKKYPKAIEKLDEVLYYDPAYGEALMIKSHALFGQKHFVKSLRHYRRAVKADESLKDNDYYRLLLKSANDERSNFPKIKLNIYAGDEHYSKGEYKKAVESYDKALINPSRFKEKILSKLLNKKGSALLKLGRYDDAYECFKKSNNDFSHFGQGVCEYNLGLEINDEFKGLLNIDKKYQLKQAVILDDMGFHEESMTICNHLYKNHFKCDDFYRKLTELM